MKKWILCLVASFSLTASIAQKEITVGKKDRKRNVLLHTNYGDIILQLSDSTPLHRDNFLLLVKKGFYDSVLFHRVINQFMIQSGDPDSKKAAPGIALGNGGPGYTVPAEFRTSLFHRKGALAAARTGDDVNPEKASSGSQFYTVQGKKFTDAGLDSLENMRLHRKLSLAHREVYKADGGTPFLDQNYTVFGHTVKGFDVIDTIAAVPTSKQRDRDRPITDARIISAKLVKRKKRY